MSERVIEVVAKRVGCEQTELEPLYYSIDPDCLDELFPVELITSSETIRRMTFTYEGHTVTVSSDGSIDAFPIEDRSSESSVDTPPPSSIQNGPRAPDC